MPTYKQITSPQNSFIKELAQLKEKSRNRRTSGLFLVEGQREIQLAQEGGYLLKSILYCPDLVQLQTNDFETAEHHIEISTEVYRKLAHRDTTEGMIALFYAQSHDLNSLKLTTDHPLILVAEAPEKPGNIGAILRTADAAHVDAVIIANPKTDLYNPNIIRSSVGCVFTNTIAVANTEEIISFLKQSNCKIFCAALQASVAYHTQDYTGATAIVVGTEATGLDQEWLDQSSQNIIIPMSGKIDSMNVSVAAGILIFEAKRQRGFS